MRKPQLRKGVKKLEMLPAWQVTKAKSQKSSSEGHRKRKGRFTSLQCWAYVTSRTRIWSKSSKNTKGGVVLRGGVVVVDSGSCAVSRREVRQHQPQKFWTSLPDCLDAQDKQVTQCQLSPRGKWRTLRHC